MCLSVCGYQIFIKFGFRNLHEIRQVYQEISEKSTIRIFSKINSPERARTICNFYVIKAGTGTFDNDRHGLKTKYHDCEF